MAFRDWRPGRIGMISALWIVIVWVYAAVRSTMAVHDLQRQNPSETVYVVMHVSPWLALGPPLLLIAIWLMLRRPRQES